MNKQIRELWAQCVTKHTKTPMNWQDAADEFAQLLLLKCIDIAEAQAMQSTRLVHSGFLTEHGKMLHEGMFGGAMNVAVGIRERFDLWED